MFSHAELFARLLMRGTHQIFVGNLQEGMTEERLREIFAPYGEVRGGMVSFSAAAR